MEPFNTACIVYPVDFPSNRTQPDIKDLHSTVIFLGDIDSDLDGIDFDTLASLFDKVETNAFQWVDTLAWDAFGPVGNIPVITLQPTSSLLDIRNQCEQVLNDNQVNYSNKFPYRPHVSVDMKTRMDGNFPESVFLRQAQLWYRDERCLIGTARFKS